MRHSVRLLQVYVELRDIIGEALAAGELFAMAGRLLDLTGRRDVIDRCGRMDETSFGAVPIDRAMRDGGWALLCDTASAELFGDDAAEHAWQPGHRRSPAALSDFYA